MSDNITVKQEAEMRYSFNRVVYPIDWEKVKTFEDLMEVFREFPMQVNIVIAPHLAKYITFPEDGQSIGSR